MLKEAIFHRPKGNWAYGYDDRTVHLRIRTKRGDVERVDVIHGDKCTPWSDIEARKMTIMASDELFDYWEAAVQPPYRRLSYGFILSSGSQQLWYTERGFSASPPSEHLGLFEYPCLNPADILTPPGWVKDAVFYQIFVERFANGDPSISPDDALPWGGKPEYYNFFGGDLQGVIDHLDHLSELGVNAIYFNPLFDAPANHKYDTRDYMKVDPHFGTNETLKAVVDACHERGIRVMLDAVFNHCGVTFAPFADVTEKGEASEYWDWFHIRRWPLEVVDGIPTYETFAFEATMPKFNTSNPQVKDYLLRAAKYWIEEIGIDGWRLDVANEVDHQFWREFRNVVKRANPEAYILGEVWHDSLMWLQGDQFDGVMNYPLANATLDFFVYGHVDALKFANKVSEQLAWYPKQASEACFNLLGSHDTVRLLTLCGNDKRKMRLAVLFQFTFAGAPCIYYGDEIGLDGEFDPDNRKCMEWDSAKQDRELFDFHQRVIALRKKHSALRSGAFRILLAEENDRLLAYERSDGHERLIVLVNPSEETRTIRVPLPDGEWRDGFEESGGLAGSSDGCYSEVLEPYGYRILVAAV